MASKPTICSVRVFWLMLSECWLVRVSLVPDLIFQAILAVWVQELLWRGAQRSMLDGNKLDFN